jgi:hypothetical protein
MPPITTTLSQPMHLFLLQESKQKKVPRNKIIEMGLHLYQKEQLKKSVSEGFEERKNEYQTIQNDFQTIQSHSLLA